MTATASYEVLASSPAHHNCPSSHDNQRLLTHKTDHSPQFKTPNRSCLTWINTSPASGQQAPVFSALVPFLLSIPVFHSGHPTMLRTIPPQGLCPATSLLGLLFLHKSSRLTLTSMSLLKYYLLARPSLTTPSLAILPALFFSIRHILSSLFVA